MKKTILEIYALATCFMAIIFLLINISEGLYSIIGVVNPSLTMSSYRYNKLQTNERYRKECCKKDSEIKSEEEITKLRTQAYEVELRSESRASLQKLIKKLIFILLSSIILYIHWKISKSTRVSGT